jgi:hypothetical protein
MAIKYKNKQKQKHIFVLGKGLVNPRKKHFVKGKGLGDFLLNLTKPLFPLVKTIATNKELSREIGKTAVDTFNVDKNTKELIKDNKDNKSTSEIIKKIKEINIGKGFNKI